MGSFAIEDYAHGSYTSILLLHFFLNSHHGAAAWSTALELKRASKDGDEHLESDAVVFWRSLAFDSDPPSVLFAECKSNNTFKAEDLDRAKRFLTEFPGSIFVFATMKTQLGQTEKQRIRKLVKEVAPHISANYQEYKPILILTATELFNSFGPPSCWREAGGRFAEFAEKVGYWQELLELCDQTQRLHLSR